MAEYRSNSDKSREKQINKPVPEKKIEKVVQGEVRSKKKSGLQKITDAFVPDDVANVKSYIIEDIVVPAAKEILLDSVKAILGINSKNGNSHRHLGYHTGNITTMIVGEIIVAVEIEVEIATILMTS